MMREQEKESKKILIFAERLNCPYEKIFEMIAFLFIDFPIFLIVLVTGFCSDLSAFKCCVMRVE